MCNVISDELNRISYFTKLTSREVKLLPIKKIRLKPNLYVTPY